MKFQIVHAEDGDQVFIRVKADNNEITLVGETQHNVSDALQTIMRIKEDAGYAMVEEVDGRTHTLLWSHDGSGLGQPTYYVYDDICSGTCDTSPAPHFHTQPQTPAD